MFTSKLSKKLAFLLIFSLFLCVLQSAAQNNKHDEPLSEEHYEILKKRKELIEQEVSSVKNEWSGTYQSGDHHPTTFMWSEGQGFLTWGSNHTFSPSRVNFGKAEFSNNRLIVKPEVSKEHLNFQFTPPELLPVKWDEQHFLIPVNELMDFAYAVNSGDESRIVEYFVKSEDYEKPRRGLPNLPKEFVKILTMKAIKPKIIAVKTKGDYIFDTEVILNLGRGGKVGEGMIFYYEKPSGGMKIIIIDLQEKSSKAKLIGIADNGTENIKPKVGLKFSSKVRAGNFYF